MSAVCKVVPPTDIVFLKHNVDSIPPFVSVWCDYLHYGDKVLFRGREAVVFTAFPSEVGDGFVPLVFEPSDSYFFLAHVSELSPLLR